MFRFKHFLISSFKRLSRLGIVTEVRQHVRFVYLMSFNHFQLATVNQLFSLTVKVKHLDGVELLINLNPLQ
jgi:hypothetical protein